MINRDFCVLDNKSSITELTTFKKIPLYMGCVETPIQDDIFCDQIWGISENGLVQLKSLIEPDLLYENSHYPGNVGKIWQSHHIKFYNFIVDSFKENNSYLEIGGASGNLCKNFSNLKENFNYEIIEPSSQKSNDKRIKYIKGFYEEQEINKKYDCIIHSHVFEHVYNPINFLKKIYYDLKPNGQHFISIPNMKVWIENGYTNALNFEHTYYIDENIIEYLLNRVGFKVETKIVDDHSIFIKSIKVNEIEETNFEFSYIKDLFLNYVSNLEKDIERINDQIGDDKIYIFGAHIFSQILLNLGINENNVICILDNNPQKIGRRLYGTELTVQSPKILHGLENPKIVLKTGIYNEEIKNEILKINSSSIFI